MQRARADTTDSRSLPAGARARGYATVRVHPRMGLQGAASRRPEHAYAAAGRTFLSNTRNFSPKRSMAAPTRASSRPTTAPRTHREKRDRRGRHEACERRAVRRCSRAPDMSRQHPSHDRCHIPKSRRSLRPRMTGHTFAEALLPRVRRGGGAPPLTPAAGSTRALRTGRARSLAP
jgi:hypothetical protein